MRSNDPFARKEVFIPRGAAIPENFALYGMSTTHHFVGKGYTKLYELPPGGIIGQHKHKRPHEAALLLGHVLMEVEGARVELRAPWQGVLLANASHEITAIEHSLWACIWPDAEGAVTEKELEAKVVAA